MTVIAVVAILLAVAVPSFRDMTQRNRVATEVNAFAGDLQFARSEAIKQGVPVTVCASSNGTSCLGNATWNTGWIVFADPDNSKTVNNGEIVIRRQAAFTGTDTFAASNGVAAITYSRDGFAMGLTANATVTLTLRTIPANSGATRCVAVNFVGSQEVQKVNGSNCT